MTNNNNASKKSFNVNEVIRRTGFCADNITAIKAAGVKDVQINALGRIVVTWGDKLVMWDAPATPAGKVAAQRALWAAGFQLAGVGVLKAAMPAQKPSAEAEKRNNVAAAPAPAKVNAGAEKQASAKVNQGDVKPASAKVSAPAASEADWDALADAKAAEKTEELLELLGELGEQDDKAAKEAAKKEAKKEAAKLRREAKKLGKAE